MIFAKAVDIMNKLPARLVCGMRFPRKDNLDRAPAILQEGLKAGQ
jgi:hypothetical protein